MAKRSNNGNLSAAGDLLKVNKLIVEKVKNKHDNKGKCQSGQQGNEVVHLPLGFNHGGIFSQGIIEYLVIGYI